MTEFLVASACATAEAGDFGGAIRLFRECVSIDSTASTWEMLAQCHMEMHEYPQALHAAKRALLVDRQVRSRSPDTLHL